MGILAKSLDEAGKRPSAYSVKKTDLFAEIKDRIHGAILPAQLVEVEEWLDANDHTLPSGWRDAIDDMIEVQRDAIAAEDIGGIIRDRFDFT